jgi:hypothetical protein
MRALIAAEAGALPEVAADYLQRSWNRNLARLAEALGTLDRRGLLAIDDAATAAEQFVWLTIAAPLNRLTLQGAPGRYSDRELKHTADEAVTTFLSRYRRHDRN